jgi:hypothetical protein
MHVNKDRTDELDFSLIAKDFVIKNDRRLLAILNEIALIIICSNSV